MKRALLLTAVLLAHATLAVSVAQTNAPAIYDPSPDDSWNRIFAELFSRTIRTMVSTELPGGTVQMQGTTAMPTFNPPPDFNPPLVERFEEGDRAIEALYPSFITMNGLIEVLTEPRFKRLKEALTDAMAETRTRPPLARALMQIDLWSAHDQLARLISRASDRRLGEWARPAADLRPLLARLMKKVALTPEEIGALPDTFARDIGTNGLPDLFSKASGWMEIVWLSERSHDREADYRRASRVFVLPVRPPPDRQQFLNGLRHDQMGEGIAAVALVVQNLVVDNRGRVTPTRLSFGVQTRVVTDRNAVGVLRTTDVHEYELSRRALLSGAGSGFGHTDGRGPAYYTSMGTGNDYGFASPQRNMRGETAPLLVSLGTRCTPCHGRSVRPTTFNMVLPRGSEGPPVTLLAQPNDIRATFVAARKEAAEDFKALKQIWEQP